MTQLMPAAEKRRRYETATDRSTAAELETVTEQINNAPGFSIRLKKALSKPVEKVLRASGYTCGYVQTGICESEYEVSW